MSIKELRKQQNTILKTTKQLEQWLNIFYVLDSELSQAIYEISALSYTLQAKPSKDWRELIQWDKITVDDNITYYYYGDFRLVTVE